MSTDRAPRQHGVTLVELIIFIVIVSVAVIGVLGVLSYTTRYSSDPLRQKQALMLAEAFMEEIELAGFTYCQPGSSKAESATGPADCAGFPENFGPEGETRPYDNVNDYWSADGMPFNDPVTHELKDAANNTIDLAGYTVKVAIAAEDFIDIAGSTNGDVLHITVTVTYDNARQVRLDGYRTRYAPVVQ